MQSNPQTAAEIIKALDLEPYCDGVFRSPRDASENHYLLMGDGFLGWHKHKRDLKWSWREGAACVVTVSPNGHDASSVNLSSQNRDLAVQADEWMTLVSVGQWSLIDLSYNPIDDAITFAAEDWYPKPRSS